MPRGVAFDELLDEKLASEPIDSKPAVTCGPAGMATAYGFFFVDAPRTAVASFSAQYELSMGRRASAVSVSGQSAVDERFAAVVNTDGVRIHLRVETAQAATPQPLAVRPVQRHLTMREQRAFDELEALGGTLTVDFTFDELRSVFRRLARRYHPDRHTGCSAHDKTRLADQFTRARDAYQVLAEHFTRVN